MRLKNIRDFLVLFAVLASPIVCAYAVNQDHLSDLAPTRDQTITSIEVVNQLSKRHYLDVHLNDSLSERFFDRYMLSLDGSKNVFLQNDIAEFKSYRFQLDDSLKRGDLSHGFYIFNRYRNRLTAQLTRIVNDLPGMIEHMDFSQDESIILDRKDQNWPADLPEANDLWRKRIKSAVLNLRLAGKDEAKIKELLEKRFKNQLSRVKQLNNEDVFQLYMNSLTQLYDPHTNYLSPQSSENFNINMSLKLEGIGAVLQREDDFTKVVRLVHAGPADKEGELQPSDRIISVGQGAEGEMVDVIGWRLDEVVQLIRGEKDTTVRLEIIPVNAKSDQETKIVSIVRDEVKLEEQSAQKKIIEIVDENKITYKVGIIDIPTFYIDFDALRRRDPNYRSTTRDVSRLLNELMEEKVSGVIIDLRDNGGGSLKEANELTGLFIDFGPTVQIRHASERIFREQKLNSTPFYDGPLLVLINRLSASASEIFAAAMQDYQRAIVVGGQSFGKGTVQSLTPLRHGQLKLTESKFYRISGDSTQHRGVIPDVELPPLYDQTKVGESSLEDALAWDKINGVKHRIYFNVPQVLPVLNKKHQERVAKDPDFQFLVEEMAELQAESNKNNILSLNEAKRKTAEENEKKSALSRENKRRIAKGLKPLESFSELKQDNPDDGLAANDDAGGNTTSDEAKDDIYLTEAGHILVDAIDLFNQKKVASAP